MRTNKTLERRELGTRMIDELSGITEYLESMNTGYEFEFYDGLADRLAGLLNDLDISGRSIDEVRAEFESLLRVASEVNLSGEYEGALDHMRGSISTANALGMLI